MVLKPGGFPRELREHGLGDLLRPLVIGRELPPGRRVHEIDMPIHEVGEGGVVPVPGIPPQEFVVTTQGRGSAGFGEGAGFEIGRHDT